MRNVKGLTAKFAGMPLTYQMMIALVVTLGSFVLIGISVLKQIEAKPELRWLLFGAGVIFSLTSFSLSFIGALADHEKSYEVQALQNPALLALEDDLDDLMDNVAE